MQIIVKETNCNICHWSSLQKREFFLEEVKNIKIVLFLIHELFR